MIKKYKTGSDNKIHEVDVDREADKCVWVKYSWGGTSQSRRERKKSIFLIYHDTYDQAYNFILNRARRKLENAESSLARAKRNLAEVEEMGDE